MFGIRLNLSKPILWSTAHLYADGKEVAAPVQCHSDDGRLVSCLKPRLRASCFFFLHETSKVDVGTMKRGRKKESRELIHLNEIGEFFGNFEAKQGMGKTIWVEEQKG